MTDVRFHNVLPKKFRYYAKSMIKISPPCETAIIKQQDEPAQHGDTTDDESQDVKLGTVSAVDRHCSSNKDNSLNDKNVLPTPPGSPDEDEEEDHSWSISPVGNGPLLADMSPMSLLSALERHRIQDLHISHDNKPISLTKTKDSDRTTSQNYLKAVPSLPGIPFIPGDLDNPIIARALASSVPKRLRGEKKPIPSEQKDDKYFERRKRNNMAAKKSRDARKSREDHIAIRANLLEKENAILRAQVSTLREEANSLRQLLIRKRNNRVQ